MRSTPVKDAGPVLMDLAVSQAGRAGSTGAGEFRKIWNSQVNKGNTDAVSADAGKKDPVIQKAQRGASLQEKEASAARKDTAAEKKAAGTEENAAGTESLDGTEESIAAAEGAVNADGADAEAVEGTDIEALPEGPEAGGLPADQESADWMAEIPDTQTDGLTPEELVPAMEVLGGITAELMQRLADTFGITLEEVQAVMDDLGMAQADLLDKEGFGNLVLKLGGAEDSYALITDGELYEKYRELTAQLDTALQEGGEKLDMEPGRMQQVLREAGMQGTAEETVPVTLTEGRENVRQYAEEDTGSEGAVTVKAGQEAVQKTQETQETANQNAGQGEERHPEGRTGRNQQEGMYVQDYRAEQFQPELQQTQEAAQGSPWSENTQDIMNQILDYMKLQLNADSTDLEMQLHPASLGTLQVQLASRGGVVTAHFIAQDEAVKNALETQMVQLREQFEEQGVKVEAIEVTVQTHEFERNLEQGRGRDQQAPDKKGRGRRIQLGGLTSPGDSDEEASVAERLDGAGSTVEYTA